MNLPGLLVEYLINGCIAMIWLASFQSFDTISNFSDSEKLLLIPLAYVLGMFIDFIAWFFTQPIKKLIRGKAVKIVGKTLAEKGETIDKNDFQLFWDEMVEIEKSYPHLNQALKSRSSRDRIARGTIFNVIAISICYWHVLSWLGIILIILSILMWMNFELYNRCYEIRAAISVRRESK